MIQSLSPTPCVLLGLALLFAAGLPATAEEPKPSLDLSKDKVLYIVSTAHLDTQWRWTIQDTITKHLPKTLRENFQIFEKCPHYKFSFEGAFRYALIKEYYPQEYAKLKDYVAKGQWLVAGSFVDACDVNVPSPESLCRQILYGNGFFRREFGKTSCDVFLPDCFGFGYALPAVAAHCGLKGFSTQKLSWGSSAGTPFDLGVWEGVDGSRIVAALNPGGYGSKLGGDIRKDPKWAEKIEALGAQSGVYAGYKYIGTGDTGGSPGLPSGEWIEKSFGPGGPFQVLSASSDQLFRDLTPAQMNKLPQYKGELLLTTHGTGCYTSQCAMKRWNRKNELLADGAERAAVAASWLGGAPYPREVLRAAWFRFLWHQFHDDLTGTSIPQAYQFSWNDERLSLNQFQSVLAASAGAVAAGLDTRVQGVPLVVYNPLAIARLDVVEATVRFPGAMPKAVRVFGPEGAEFPAQMGAATGDAVQVVFVASVPPLSFTVYDVRPSPEGCDLETGLAVDEKSLRSNRYAVALDANGDLATVKDLSVNKELLAAPARWALLADEPSRYPAWEINPANVQAPPRAYVQGGLKVQVLERGPARVMLEVTRETEGSTFVQRWSMCAGSAAAWLQCDARVDWRTRGTLLKAVFPLASANPKAAYDLGLGAIERGNNTPKLYEVPAQQWADLAAPDGFYGVAILNDCKYGWDKPDDQTLRLTLIHTPGTRGGYGDQASLDLGRHQWRYALTDHPGDWRKGQVPHQAARLNQPLLAFQAATKHAGPLGKALSFLSVSTPQVAVRSLKLAEESDEVVIRVVELEGRAADNVTLAFAAPVLAAREVNGSEEPLGPAAVRDDKLTFALRPFQPRAFAVKLTPPNAALPPPAAQPVDLPYDQVVTSTEAKRTGGDFDGLGHSLPAELLPATLTCQGLPFKLGPTQDGAKNAVACRGQTIALLPGPFNAVYVLAAAAGGDAKATFAVDATATEVTVQDFTGFVGQWDRPGAAATRDRPATAATPGFVKPATVAWIATHRHDKQGTDEPYVFCYLFKYRLAAPEGAKTVKLPDNEKIKVLALTVAQNPNDDVTPAGPPAD